MRLRIETTKDNSFFESIDLSDQENKEREYTEQRIQKINLHNVTFADAILCGALTSKKRKEDDS